MTDWRDSAACRPGGDVEPELFFISRSGPRDDRVVKAVCRACPVRVECLEWALANREDAGVWGGLTEDERRRLRRRRARAS